MPSPTHYQILGVAPNADGVDIRDAYRRLAREHHPDRTASTDSNRTFMPAINDAYRVLSDPGRRAVYDAGLRGSSQQPQRGPGPASSYDSTSPGPPQVFPSHLGPARIPWRSLLFVGVIACMGIVALAQFTEPGEPPLPDGLLRVGSCVAIEPNGDAREVACTDDSGTDDGDDLVVEAFVPFDATCPTRTVAHRDRQGMGIACIGETVEIGG